MGNHRCPYRARFGDQQAVCAAQKFLYRRRIVMGCRDMLNDLGEVFLRAAVVDGEEPRRVLAFLSPVRQLVLANREFVADADDRGDIRFADAVHSLPKARADVEGIITVLCFDEDIRVEQKLHRNARPCL